MTSTTALVPAHSPLDMPAVSATRSRVMGLLGPVSRCVPAVGFALGGYWGLKGARRPALLALGGAVGLALFRWQFARFFTEQATYEVERRIGELEIRRYAPTVRAETTVSDATWSEALNQGFERVAGSIFGGNQRDTKIAMTAPVLAHVGETERTDRTVSFIMPADRTVERLPIPRDSKVHLRAAPARRMAAHSFRGRYGGALPAAERAELLKLVHAAGLTAISDVEFAGYDAPSTLPAFRRNEVLVEISNGAATV